MSTAKQTSLEVKSTMIYARKGKRQQSKKENLDDKVPVKKWEQKKGEYSGG